MLGSTRKSNGMCAAESSVWTGAPISGVCVRMETGMDEDTIDLVRQLLCRAGMDMEDVCHIAVAPGRDVTSLRQAAQRVSAGLTRARALTLAAMALMGV